MRWIRSRLADATERATRQLDALDLGGYASTVYEAAWSDYCDWFLEMAKVDMRRDEATDADRDATWRAAAEGLALILRLLHPLMPFVTEAIWDALDDVAPEATAGERLLITARWPQAATRDHDAERAFDDVSGLVRGVRNLRTKAGTPAGAWVPLGGRPAECLRRGRARRRRAVHRGAGAGPAPDAATGCRSAGDRHGERARSCMAGGRHGVGRWCPTSGCAPRGAGGGHRSGA